MRGAASEALYHLWAEKFKDNNHQTHAREWKQIPRHVLIFVNSVRMVHIIRSVVLQPPEKNVCPRLSPIEYLRKPPRIKNVIFEEKFNINFNENTIFTFKTQIFSKLK